MADSDGPDIGEYNKSLDRLTMESLPSIERQKTPPTERRDAPLKSKFAQNYLSRQ